MRTQWCEDCLVVVLRGCVGRCTHRCAGRRLLGLLCQESQHLFYLLFLFWADVVRVYSNKQTHKYASESGNFEELLTVSTFKRRVCEQSRSNKPICAARLKMIYDVKSWNKWRVYCCYNIIVINKRTHTYWEHFEDVWLVKINSEFVNRVQWKTTTIATLK